MKYEKKDNTEHILKVLDRLYGTEKRPFYHHADWQLLVAIMLSAQSTDKQVEEAIPAFFDRYTKAEEVAELSLEEIEVYIRTIGLYKSKAKHIKECCRQITEEFSGNVPDTIEKLIRLAGVGRKTATLYLADAKGIPGVTVDTHVFRVARRLGWTSGKNPYQVEKELEQVLPVSHWNRINFQLIYLGRAVCTARKAKCIQCPLERWCGKHLE